MNSSKKRNNEKVADFQQVLMNHVLQGSHGTTSNQCTNPMERDITKAKDTTWEKDVSDVAWDFRGVSF